MNVKKKFAKDVAYSGVSKYSTIIITLLVTAVLARILTPDDFGVVAIATVFIAFFNLLSDFGIATAIVQYKDLKDDDLKNIFGWTFWLGLILSALFFIISPFVSNFYDNEFLKPVCELLSIQVFFATLNIVPNALLLKSKRFDVLALRTVVVQFICGIIAIAAAFNGIGVYSLLINPILGVLAIFIINEYYLRLSISFFPSVSSIKKIFSFSFFQFLFNFINYIGNNIDKMIIGKSFNMISLGYYEKAYRLEHLPAQAIVGVISPVLHPYLSDYQNNTIKILEIYNKMNRMLLSISFPISAFCLLCARELILILFGPQWMQSIMYFAVISISVATQLATVHAGAILQSSNRTKLLFVMGFINVVIAITALFIGAFGFKSILAICYCGVLSSIICAVLSYIIIYKYCFNTTAVPMLKYALKPVCCYILIGFMGYLLSDYFLKVPLILSFLLKILLWGIITFLFLQFFTQFKPSVYFGRILSKKLLSHKKYEQ